MARAVVARRLADHVNHAKTNGGAWFRFVLFLDFGASSAEFTGVSTEFEVFRLVFRVVGLKSRSFQRAGTRVPKIKPISLKT